MQKTWHSGGALAYWTWAKSGLYTSVSSRTLKELLVRSFKLFPKRIWIPFSISRSRTSGWKFGPLVTQQRFPNDPLSMRAWAPGLHGLIGTAPSCFYYLEFFFCFFFQRWLFLVQFRINISSNIVIFYSPTLLSNKITSHRFLCTLHFFYDVFL